MLLEDITDIDRDTIPIEHRPALIFGMICDRWKHQTVIDSRVDWCFIAGMAHGASMVYYLAGKDEVTPVFDLLRNVAIERSKNAET